MNSGRSADLYLEGSPLDRNFFAAVLIAGLIALARRGPAVWRLLRSNRIVVLFVVYCAVSIVWSDFPLVAFKRWTKSLGDLVMVLLVLTDPSPLTAVKRLFGRVGFLLIPSSVLLIRYYGDIGRYYDRWEGTTRYCGVAVDKNMLGMSCLILGLGCLWCLLQSIEKHEKRRRVAPMIAYGTVIAMAIWLFWLANSMTSMSVFVMASTAMLAPQFKLFRRKTWMLHTLVWGMVAAAVSTLFFEVGTGVVASMGRDPTLTGRTELWGYLIELTKNPLIGTGFESFWLGSRLETLWNIYWWKPNEAHSGYLEMYINLGWVGILFLAALIVTGYRNAVRWLALDLQAGRLRLAFFFVGVVYNLTEAAMRATNPIWIMFMFAVFTVPVTKKLLVPAEKDELLAEPMGVS